MLDELPRLHFLLRIVKAIDGNKRVLSPTSVPELKAEPSSLSLLRHLYKLSGIQCMKKTVKATQLGSPMHYTALP